MSEPSFISDLNTSSAVMCRWDEFWNTSRILIRGNVAFRPLLLRSSACDMAGFQRRRTGRKGKTQPVESPNHIEVAARAWHTPVITMPTHLPAFLRPWLGALAVAALAGCSSLQSSDNLVGIVTPYRIEVVQGNVLTHEQVQLVKIGQSRTQVRDLLGSPLLTD